MRRDARLGRIGLTLLGALGLTAAAILMVGEQNFLFTKTNEYFVLFPTVAGLAEGNPVQLSGVIVGRIDRIVLPEDITKDSLEVWISVERRYAQRIRQDSVARIKTLGLLGDKYIEITSGSPPFMVVQPAEQIAAAPPTDMDRLIASGEDVIENVVETAASLSSILERMDQGEGLLGELLAEREGEGISESLTSTLKSIESVARQVEAGEGTVGRLISDRSLADEVTTAVDNLSSILSRVERGEGIVGSLISEGESKERFDNILEKLDGAVSDLSELATALHDGDGLLPRLISDEQYGDQVSTELLRLLEQLNLTVEKVTQGEGTAARLINDPGIYEALNDILVGIDESKMLRWLIRNRQKKGIEVRYEDAQSEVPSDAPPQTEGNAGPSGPDGG